MTITEMAIKPVSRGQEKLLRALRDKNASIVGVFGPTGTGKSLLTVSYAIDAVSSGLYERAVYSKPIIDVSTGKEISIHQLGAKFEEIMKRYVMDLFTGVIETENIERLIAKGKLQLSDTHYIRGRTFDSTFLIVDDAQNLSSETIIEILSRLGRDSKLVIIGDPIFQSHTFEKNPILDLRSIFLTEKDAALIDLGLNDIVRPGAKKALKLLLELRMRKRTLTSDEMRVKQALESIAPDVDIVTVADLRPMKERSGIGERPPVADCLIIVKEGHYGRAVGKKGERINRLEKELGLKARVAEASLNLINIIEAVHPLPNVVKSIEDIDIEGVDLVIYVNRDTAGALFGQKGAYLRFVDSVLKYVMGMGIFLRETGTERRKASREE